MYILNLGNSRRLNAVNCRPLLSFFSPLTPQVESDTKYERIGGTSIGGGTFWGMGSILTKAKVLYMCIVFRCITDFNYNGHCDLILLIPFKNSFPFSGPSYHWHHPSIFIINIPSFYDHLQLKITFLWLYRWSENAGTADSSPVFNAS